MTNTDSFLAEVSEEVRRDRLFALFRRYGWIGIVVILLAVGGAGYREWNRAQQQRAAEEFGDGLRAAIAESEPTATVESLAIMQPTGDQVAFIGFVKAQSFEDSDDSASAMAELEAIAGNEDISAVYRDLAELKLILAQASELPHEELLQRLSPLESPGAPFRLLAREAHAHALIRVGKLPEAAELLTGLQHESAVPQDLKGRISQLLTTLESELNTVDDSE